MTTHGHAQAAARSEKNLHRYLAYPRVTRAKDHTEGTGVEVSVWIEELSMVEDVEKLRPELGTHALRDFGVFQEGQIEVVDTGAVKETPVGSIQKAQWFGTERRGVKVELARSGIGNL